MRQARWLAPWKDSFIRPAIYHVVSRVVDRRSVFGPREKEVFRNLLRKYEHFSGCRVLSYCLMSNHFHLLLEVSPLPPGGLSEAEFSSRLAALYPESAVDEITAEIRTALVHGDKQTAEGIRSRYLKRMHDLSQFMRGLLQRFTRWFNRTHGRRGTLWEDRFKSVIVENGEAARTVAAYIDMNPVRAGIAQDPAEYRWSSYGEAVGGGRRARAGLVRLLSDSHGVRSNARRWSREGIDREYRRLLLGGLGAHESGVEDGEAEGGSSSVAPGVLNHRIRYFVDGLVIGSRNFVDEVFQHYRSRFGRQRRSGARKPRGALSPLAGVLWSMRDLRVDTG